jgi:hypothetical protein
MTSPVTIRPITKRRTTNTSKKDKDKNDNEDDP